MISQEEKKKIIEHAIEHHARLEENLRNVAPSPDERAKILKAAIETAVFQVLVACQDVQAKRDNMQTRSRLIDYRNHELHSRPGIAAYEAVKEACAMQRDLIRGRALHEKIGILTLRSVVDGIEAAGLLAATRETERLREQYMNDPIPPPGEQT